MKKLFLAAAFALTLIPSAQAGWGDLLNAAAQAAGGVAAQRQQPTAAPQPTTAAAPSANVTPISAYELEKMSCAMLQVSSRQAKRDLEENRSKLQQLDAMVKDPAYQQQQSSNATLGLIGTLMASTGKGSAAEYGRTLAETGANNSLDKEIELQLALNRKHSTDIDNIGIYLIEKKCGR